MRLPGVPGVRGIQEEASMQKVPVKVRHEGAHVALGVRAAVAGTLQLFHQAANGGLPEGPVAAIDGESLTGGRRADGDPFSDDGER